MHRSVTLSEVQSRERDDVTSSKVHAGIGVLKPSVCSHAATRRRSVSGPKRRAPRIGSYVGRLAAPFCIFPACYRSASSRHAPESPKGIESASRGNPEEAA